MKIPDDEAEMQTYLQVFGLIPASVCGSTHV